MLQQLQLMPGWWPKNRRSALWHGPSCSGRTSLHMLGKTGPWSRSSTGLKITFRGRPWAVPALVFSPRFPDRDERRPPSAGTGRCQALPAAVLGASASSAQTHNRRISRTDQKTCENRILKWFQHPQWKHDVHLIRCYTKAEVGTRQSRAIDRLAKFIH